MKTAVFGARTSEGDIFREEAALHGSEVVLTSKGLDEETLPLIAGCDAVAIVATNIIDDAAARTLSEHGVKYILTRGTGYDHISREAVKKYGLRCANVPVYSYNAVSEHAVLLLLALLRGFKDTLRRADALDFRLPRRPSRELGEMTVGVFGTGFIGGHTARTLHGMGSRVLAYTPHPKPELEGVVEYVSRDELFARCEAIVFHCSLTPETRNVVNRENIAKMREGMYLVNAARGELFDFEAILEGLRSGRLGGLATDVYVDEGRFIYKDLKGQPTDPVMAGLLSMDNVLFTPHIAYYTDTAVRNMIRVTFDNLVEFCETGGCKNEILK